MNKIIVSSFYKYVNIKDLKSFRKKHLEFCNKLGIKGKVLVSKEGINGSISGTIEQIKKYNRQEYKCHRNFISASCFYPRFRLMRDAVNPKKK